MTSIHFPFRPRVDDLQAAQTVQRNLDFLAEIVQDLINGMDMGTSLVPTGATSAAVQFNQSIPNPKITVTPGANVGSWWVDGRTPLGFTLHIANAAPSGGALFDWSARGG
jgi:hypothetical protein